MVLMHADEALAACREAAQRVTEADLDSPTPCSGFTVADLTDHVIRSMTLLADVAGTTLHDDATAPAATRIAGLATGAISAWRSRGLDGSVAVGRSVLPARVAAEIVPLELLVHGWDLARATGHRLVVSTELAESMLVSARELVTPDKRGKSFAAEVAVGADATALERLIAFTGREP